MNTSDGEEQKSSDIFFSQIASCGVREIGFHVPGHIGARFFDDLDCRRLIGTDTTELSSTDDLHDPKGPILESLRSAAEVFGSEYSFYLCSGTTTGLRIMLSAVLDESSVLLLPRSVHLSVVWTLGIIGCKYLFLPGEPPVSDILSPLCMPDSQEMDRFLSSHPEVTDVFVTSPDYYGRCANLSELARVVHGYHCRLLVDEAHGAHFAFGGDSFPPTAMRAGADISISSLHKTLPALTPSAILNVSKEAHRGGRVMKQRIMESLGVFETSSPSFMIAASAELAISRMKRLGPDAFERAADRVQRLVEDLKRLPGISTADSGDLHERDPLRMTLNTSDAGIFAPDVRDALERKGIYAEFSDPVRMVFIFSVLHEESDYKSLEEALMKIFSTAEPIGLTNGSRPDGIDRLMSHSYTRIPVSVIPLRKAVFGRRETKLIKLSDCAGKISAMPITLYPPGIPVVWPGERVPEETAELLLKASEIGIRLNGLSDGFFEELERSDRRNTE